MVKCLIQGRNNVTKVRLEPRSCDQNRRKKRRLYPLWHAAYKKYMVTNVDALYGC